MGNYFSKITKNTKKMVAKATNKKTGKKAAGKKGDATKKVQVQTKAGISFPVTRIRNAMRKLRANKTVTMTAAVAAAAVLEHLCAEVTDAAGSLCLDQKKQTLNQKHLFQALDGDDELRRVFNGLIHE